MQWLLISIALSVVLTVVLNVGLRLVPGSHRRITSSAAEPDRSAPGEDRHDPRPVRVWAPWKAMLVGSLILTIVLNLVLWIAR